MIRGRCGREGRCGRRWRKVREGAMFCVVVQDLTMLLKENKRVDIRPLLLTAFLVRPGRQLSSRG